MNVIFRSIWWFWIFFAGAAFVEIWGDSGSAKCSTNSIAETGNVSSWSAWAANVHCMVGTISDHGRIGFPLVGTIHEFLVQTSNFHFWRTSRTLITFFQILNLYRWCVLPGERNELSHFRHFTCTRRFFAAGTIWCTSHFTSVEVPGRVFCEVLRFRRVV